MHRGKRTIFVLNFFMLGLASLLGLSIRSAFAREFGLLYRGARAQAMGNAFTAVADDEQTLFYNPAGLAGIQKFSLDLVSVNLDLSSELISSYPTFVNAFSDASVSSINTFIGKNLYARAQGTSILSFPGFAIAYIYDQQVALRLENQVFPQGLIGYQATRGVQFGFGGRVLKLKRKRGELRFGIAAKVLSRTGGYAEPTFTQILSLDYQSIRNIFSTTGTGFGLDAGFQFVYVKKKLTLLAGLVGRDMGNTAFSNGVDPIQMNVTGGLAAKYSSGDMKATLAYDYSQIFDNTDWKKKNHLGFELAFPVVSLYGGMNQLSLTYGAGLDLGMIRVMYLTYAEDQAPLANQDSERRQMVHFTFKFEL
jgi:hypothetical protein